MKDDWIRAELADGFKKIERHPDEVLLLQELAAEWEAAGSFWPMASLMQSFTQAGVFAIYELGARTGSPPSSDPRMMAFLVFQWHGDFADLLYVFVSKALRRQGTGHRMVSAWLGVLAQLHECKRVMLEVRESNFSAQRLYEACGFYRQGIRKSYYSDGEDAVIYRYDFPSRP